MRKYVLGALTLCCLFGFAACSKQDEKKETAKVEEKIETKSEMEATKLPHGHPPIAKGEQSTGESKEMVGGKIASETMGHPSGGEEKKEIKVSDEIKAKWKTARLKVIDKEKNTEETLAVAVGKEASIKNTGFSVKVGFFLPHYMRFDNYIGSKSNEPVNPAVLVELLEGGKSIAKGWVFANFTTFNTYKHERYEIVLLPIPLK